MVYWGRTYEAVELVEDGHHVPGSVVGKVDRDGVRFEEAGVGRVVWDGDVSAGS